MASRTKGWASTKASERRIAERIWATLVQAAGDAAGLWWELQREDTAEGRREVLTDALVRRSTGTLRRRGGPVLAYSRWTFRQEPGANKPFPLREPIVYAYLRQRRAGGCAPTSPKSLLQGLRVASRILRVEGLDSLESSERLLGLVHGAILGKRPTSKSRAPRVDEVIALETAQERAGTYADRKFANDVVALAYTRLRFGDYMRMLGAGVVERSDDGHSAFYENSTVETKTAGVQSKRVRQALPVAAPAIGLTGIAWGDLQLEHYEAASDSPGKVECRVTTPAREARPSCRGPSDRVRPQSGCGTSWR